MKTPEEIGRALQRRYELHRQAWLGRAFLGAPFEVQSFSVAVRKSEAAADIRRYAAWEETWRGAARPGIRLAEEPAAWKELGLASRLSRVQVTSLKGAFSLMPEGEELGARFLRALARLDSLVADGRQSLARACLQEARFVLDAEDDAFHRMTQVIAWLESHPKAGCYIRELPIEGVDTKWLEQNKGLVARLMSGVLGLEKPLLADDVARRWNLLSPPPLIRVRHAHLAAAGIPPDALAALPVSVLAQGTVRRAVVVENLQTGLAVSVPDDVLIVVGMGMAVRALAEVPWSREASIFYMGDLDQHGVAILGQLRRLLPQVKSVMMTLPVLKRWERLAVEDPTAPIAVPLESLTPEEQELLAHLQQGRLRLEQERLGMDEINRAFAEALRNPE